MKIAKQKMNNFIFTVFLPLNTAFKGKIECWLRWNVRTLYDWDTVQRMVTGPVLPWRHFSLE
jgi:hypothetical protein